MPALSRSELAAYAVCLALVGLLGWRALRGEEASRRHAPASTAGAASVSVAARPAATAVVHVAGAVRRPGVYRLRTDQRVQDAIRRAGGGRPGADLQAINLAAKLNDGQQIVVPRHGAAASVAAGQGAAAAAGGAGPVNLNSATAEQLDTLDGVGPATAQKILEYRAQHGGFATVDDLGQIPGIGPKRLEALRAQVTT